MNSVLHVLFFFGIYVSAKDCPDSWTVYGNSCYMFGHQTLSFFSAEQYCRQHNGYLVHINEDGENTFIREFLRSMKGVRWWIGLTDDDVENTFVWYGTNNLAEYTDWAPGQPDNYVNNEDCAEFDITTGFDGHWNDASCDMHLLPICERPVDGTSSAIVG